MLTGVVIINLLISLICFCIAVRVWKVSRTIALFEARITAMERCSTNVLGKSPNFFAKRQQRVYQLRRNYQQLELQLEQVQQLLGLLGLGRRLWRGSNRPLK